MAMGVCEDWRFSWDQTSVEREEREKGGEGAGRERLNGWRRDGGKARGWGMRRTA